MQTRDNEIRPSRCFTILLATAAKELRTLLHCKSRHSPSAPRPFLRGFFFLSLPLRAPLALPTLCPSAVLLSRHSRDRDRDKIDHASFRAEFDKARMIGRDTRVR